ncbi:MAG: HDOD domain-containing protein, partial [Planctomycetaceae bacterium]|nr:HDOD domain-containing protein [Planctomycetaceae bacterium]
ENLKEMFELLERRDAGLSEFVEKVSAFPSVRKVIIRAANSAVMAGSVNITDATHAAALLGTRRLVHLLQTMCVDDEFKASNQTEIPESDSVTV